ncbi:GNAT family N-acetyltransferase [Aestuariivirga sp.]|uniref:GNAT family N-acetyltransferase n=1 Tax=Aestuariivirga sp. TaxID=2650926 RepID=UPI0039E6CA0E
MKTLATLPPAETEQLVLREIELRDSRPFAAFMTQPAYQRHIAMKLADPAEVRAFVMRSVARQGDERRNVFHLAAEEKSSGEAVGDGFIIVQRPKLLELGWGVHPAMWAMGIGTEIGKALLGLAFERLNAERVWCKVMQENEASGRLARRIGFRHIQSHSDYPAGGGKFAAVDIYALTAPEYFDLPY